MRCMIKQIMCCKELSKKSHVVETFQEFVLDLKAGFMINNSRPFVICDRLCWEYTQKCSVNFAKPHLDILSSIYSCPIQIRQMMALIFNSCQVVICFCYF